ncbi:N5-glutamine methyltransferase family protein [Helicobacter cappadocius]|uniref:peptide chain release factor N(5)-glutamine methyltransferase n=1 Tax=Helicobacter cappadocius TaxID=3063998 RepID=A0AA90SSI4_9HELI|nr:MULTISPECIES: HemK/PrmC family methyltransferase [unclassified Helicobacter]MDO7252866.1 HemK/PrmC family methyltransferase [Helicobacter sp. faydin-H75]MDP2538909.1 HemK/PrmC family methyltransferase [Helicobacter sp. faydin-H76]
MNVFEALSYAKREFLNKGCDGSTRVGLESELLLSFAMDCTREWLHTWGDREIEACELDIFMDCISRRNSGEPIEYITQSANFYGHSFYVDKRVLIPRPETEILIEKVTPLIIEHRVRNIAEIGVGSGIISIVLGMLCSDVDIVATDISPLAIEVAQTNIDFFTNRTNRLEERIKLVNTSFLDGIEEDFEFLVSNPPYIAKDYPLEKNVLYEPENALFGGIVGDELLKSIIKLSRERKIRFLACEMGYNQKNSLHSCLRDHGYEPIFYKDLSGFDRGFIAELKS